MNPHWITPLMLLGSNVLMNIAWYGHLRDRQMALWAAVLISWGIAFFEYCLAVPANRIGSAVYSAAQLKGMQEFLSITTFIGVSWVLLGQTPSLRQLAGFALMGVAAWLVVGK